MDQPINVSLNIKLDESLLREFLQHLRDFDSKHGDRAEMIYFINAPHLSMAQVEAIFASIDPPFEFMKKVYET